MRGPWMPTSMPTTRPSQSTFGQWTSGVRVEILDRTCWETSLALRCAPWPWRARSPLWGAAPTAERGAFSDGSPNREAPTQWAQWSAARARAQRGAHRSGSHGPTFANALHHSLIKFDECRLGQVVVKSTTSTDLPLHHWHDLRCNHGAHPSSTPVTSAGIQSR